MSKITIDNRSASLSNEEAVRYVLSVIKEGMVSDSGRKYCYVTTFTNTVTGVKTVVSAYRTKAGTYSFRVYNANSPKAPPVITTDVS